MRLARPSALLALLATVAALVLASCGDDEEEAPTAAASEAECAEVEAPAPKDTRFDRPEEVLSRGEPATAAVDTSCGEFEIELDTKGSPKTANSFAFLAEEGLYDDTLFHRIAPGFVIQGGDPTGEGSGGPGYSVNEAPPDDAAYLHGTVAMAKTAVEPPGESGSQFFVVTAPADAGLPPQYALLGEVRKGIDVVERIGELGDPATEQPTQAVVIESVTVERG
ncbi:MAG: peptidylprolyl isomerase [Solirubrobacterales bacterium]